MSAINDTSQLSQWTHSGWIWIFFQPSIFITELKQWSLIKIWIMIKFKWELKTFCCIQLNSTSDFFFCFVFHCFTIILIVFCRPFFYSIRAPHAHNNSHPNVKQPSCAMYNFHLEMVLFSFEMREIRNGNILNVAMDENKRIIWRYPVDMLRFCFNYYFHRR